MAPILEATDLEVMKLTRPSGLLVIDCQYKPKGVVFLLNLFGKQSRWGKPPGRVLFCKLFDNKQLCQCKPFISDTAPLRREHDL